MTIIQFKIGDLVIKNKKTWEVNDFDSWGRGKGVGKVVKPPFPLAGTGTVDVRWPAGRCFESIIGILPAKKTKKRKIG